MDNSAASMAGKTVIVTGANAGMGLATTIELARLGAHVVMACRSKERGEAALAQAQEASGGSGGIELMLCDLASFDSVRQFAAAVGSRFGKLDVLVNNAGVVALKRQLTADGHELMLGVNHLGHFLLTLELLPLLLEAEQGRIVNVASGAHKIGNIHFDDPTLSRGFHVAKGYAQSKLANILFTNELARRLQSTPVTANSLHPGAVSTDIGVDRGSGFGRTVHRLIRPFMRSPLEGARSAIYLASAPEAARSTGGYYIDCRIVGTSRKAADPELARQLWEWSERQTGARLPEPLLRTSG